MQAQSLDPIIDALFCLITKFLDEPQRLEVGFKLELLVTAKCLSDKVKTGTSIDSTSTKDQVQEETFVAMETKNQLCIQL